MAGQTRFRKIQVGHQSVIGTAVAATRVLPYRGLWVVNPNRTNADVDVGSLDPIISPYPTALDVTMGGAAGPLAFDDLPIRWDAGIKGGVTPTGPTGTTAYTWTFQAASLTADPFSYWSVQTGDDTSDSAGAGVNGFGAVIDTFSETMPEDLGPWTASDDWVAAGAVYGNRTGSLNVTSTPAFVFGADSQWFLDTTAAAIGTTPVVAAFRGATINIANALDKKRYADGSNTRFQLAAYGRGPRVGTITVVVEKTTATIAEANTLDDTPVPNRYLEFRTISTELAGTAIPYSYRRQFPARLISVSEGEIGGNTNYTLTYEIFYDSTTTFAIKGIIVCKLASLAS